MSPLREHEFSRVGLLAELPGQTLRKLSDRMERESVPAGTEVMREGDHVVPEEPQPPEDGLAAVPEAAAEESAAEDSAAEAEPV